MFATILITAAGLLVAVLASVVLDAPTGRLENGRKGRFDAWGAV